MKKEATIYDYHNFCKSFNDCEDCPLSYRKCPIDVDTDENELKFINETVLHWLEEKKLNKTRFGKFKKIFPNARLNDYGLPTQGCPNSFDKDYSCPHHINNNITCRECYEKYWLEEIE